MLLLERPHRVGAAARAVGERARLLDDDLLAALIVGAEIDAAGIRKGDGGLDGVAAVAKRGAVAGTALRRVGLVGEWIAHRWRKVKIGIALVVDELSFAVAHDRNRTSGHVEAIHLLQ